MIKLNLNMKGIRPIILHNGRTADPLDPWAKKLKSISAKRKKTEEDHELMGEIEFEAGLYWSDALGVYMPVDNLQRMFLDACKKIRMGRESIGIMVNAEYGCPIIFPNHKNLKKLKADPEARIRKIVGLAGVKVVRTRPLVQTGWTMTIPVELDADIIDRDTFEQIAEIAGHRIGLGDWRPAAPKVPGSFGRFTVESISNGAN